MFLFQNSSQNGIPPSMRVPDFQKAYWTAEERKKEAKLQKSLHHNSNSVIFSFGEGNDMRGLSSGTISDAENPKYIRTPFRITSVVMGYTCSIALTVDGFVLSCGSNSNGQCGFKDSPSKPQFELVEDLAHEDIVQASCGYYFTLFLTRNGRVIGSGDNSHGQLVGINSVLL